MKVIIEFNLPEEEVEFYCATKGTAMLNVLFELRTEIRNMLKYGELKPNQYEILEDIQRLLIESLNDNEINLDK